jgi:molybdate/tungstate transport system ATP-binding protein
LIDAIVKKKLGTFRVDATIRNEGFICLSGKNGSGKTSLLRLILGIYTPDEGYVRIDSEIISRQPIERRGVVFVAPESCIPHLRVEKHLVWGAEVRRAWLDDRTLDDVKSRLGIHFSGRVAELSLGMKVKVALTTALLSKPKVILVDEAFASLDNREEFMKNYRDISETFSTDVVFATQSPANQSQADHLYTMAEGSLSQVF